jgi:hypothetical protein
VSVHREYMPIIIQRDATLYSLFMSVNFSTCFGRYLHPSSGAHVTVSTPSGICKTVTATCRECDWPGAEFPSSHFLDFRVCREAEKFTDINKLYIVVSCWIIIDKCFLLHIDRSPGISTDILFQLLQINDVLLSK